MRIALGLAIGASAHLAMAFPAQAERRNNPIAVFSALDKVTARISRLEVPIDQTADFGSLKITPRVCFSREPTEPPKTTSFVEVDEVKLDKSELRIFGGWMFAESPGINGLEHPVFDVWLTGCATEFQPVASAAQPTETLAQLRTEEGMPLPVRKFYPEQTGEPAGSTTVRRRRSLR